MWAMKPNRWLRDDADERLQGLFSEDPHEVHEAIRDLIELATSDSEIEELVVDTLQSSLDEENDDTQASLWLALILGEVGVESGLPVLLAALSSADESLAETAVTALRQLGRMAFEAGLARIEEDDDVAPAHFAALCEVLEGVQLHDDLPDIRARIEECLIEHLRRTIVVDDEPLVGNRLRTVETACLTLAHLGVGRARGEVDRISALTGGTNSFVLEAIEIMDEQPRGIPLRGGANWEQEFDRVTEGDWESGPGENPREPNYELDIEDTGRERILRLKRRSDSQ